MGSLVLESNKPIFQLDDAGNVVRVQYNEVFRMPSTIPFDDFRPWYAAYMQFADLIHSDEFERAVPMAEGDLLVMNNWRLLHGRDGSRDGAESNLQSQNRILVGGTVTREAVVHRARQLIEELESVTLQGPMLVPIPKATVNVPA